MPKYQQYFRQMLSLNESQFKKFREVHDNYSLDPAKYQDQFNDLGRDVQDTIREWEDKLCSHSEGTGFGKFSSTLSDKFWELIRREFPKIDYVGVKP